MNDPLMILKETVDALREVPPQEMKYMAGLFGGVLLAFVCWTQLSPDTRGIAKKIWRSALPI